MRHTVRAYLSRPAVALPAHKMDNAEVISRVKASFKGSASAWGLVHAGLIRVFEQCGSEHRYIELDPTVGVAEYAARAASRCLRAHGMAPADVDLVIYAGIAREYFEPATAMEVAARLGATTAHAFDVTSACAGQLEAICIARAFLSTQPHLRTVLICSGELTRSFLSFEIQSLLELKTKAAGMTIGNAAAAWLLRREPWEDGCAELVEMQSMSRPEHWQLCRAPIDGPFTSNSHELFKLAREVPPELRRVLGLADWQVEDVDHFVFHQPSNLMVRKVIVDLGADPDKAVLTHHLYGNTASTSVALAMHHLLETRAVGHGERLVLSTAGAGFSMVTALGQWVV